MRHEDETERPQKELFKNEERRLSSNLRLTFRREKTASTV